MSNAAKGVIGGGPSSDPDEPRVHRYGDDLSRDIRAAMRGCHDVRTRGRSRPELSLESEIRRNVRLYKMDDRC
jgi:hypothetical protein